VLKLYTTESDSAEYLQLAEESAEPVASSEILRVELAFALHQKELRGELKPGGAERVQQQFAADVVAGRWLLAPVGTDVLEQAVNVAKKCFRRRPPVSLRTLDGIHLATALVLKAQQVISTDQRLREAAVLLGLNLFPPGVK
jgi:predicted nucleic acid-binding protein